MPDTSAAPGHTRIDNRIITGYGPRLGAYALAVYLVLALHADVRTMKCFPSLRTICRLSKLSRPTALKAISALEGEGLIRVERKNTEGGKPVVNLYTLLPPGQSASPAMASGVDHEGQSHLPTTVKQIDHIGKGALPEQDLINKTQENKRDAASTGRTPAPARPMREHARDPNLDHPAVKAYRGVCRLTPDPTQRAAIAAAVDDATRWQEVMRQWLLAGYRKQNVAGMLDWYKSGIPQRRNGNGRTGSNSESGGFGARPAERYGCAPPETADEAARLDAEWEARLRAAGDVPGV